ncbi:MAG: DNA-processing protein DprA [Saprospiraceae bacterium]
MTDEIRYYLGLTRIPKVGAVTAKNLVSYCGGAEAVFKATKRQLLSIPGIGDSIANQISNQKVLKEAEEEMKIAEKNGVQLFTYQSDQYPQRLKNYPDSPVVLQYKGSADLNANRIVAIVGTRKPTDYGRTICEKLVEDLKKYNVVIVSGLAYGIDVTAHKKCVDLDIPTIGVLGSGLDVVYPSLHRKIANQMIENGGLLSEFTHGTAPDREHFPMRNRVVAGMCDALIVVETKRRGGSMITANLANDYNKDVFAFPGRNNDEFSEGCNLLIKSHKAALLDGAKDLAYVMRWESDAKTKEVQRSLFIELDKDEQELFTLIKANPKIAIDQMTMNLCKTSSEMAALLLKLEFKGLIKSLPGKRYMEV